MFVTAPYWGGVLWPSFPIPYSPLEECAVQLGIWIFYYISQSAVFAGICREVGTKQDSTQSTDH